MLKKVFNDDSKNRALLFDTDNSSLLWQSEEYTEIAPLEVTFLQQFFDKRKNNVDLKIPEDVTVVNCKPNGKFNKKNINIKVAYLYESSKELGLLFISTSNKEIDTLNKNGGIIILAKIDNVKNVVFIMPFMKVIEKIVRNSVVKKSIVNELYEPSLTFLANEKGKMANTRKDFIKKQDEEFYEAIIRIPKNTNSDDMDKLIQSNNRIFSMLQDMYEDTKNRLSQSAYQISILIEENRYYKNQEDIIKRLEQELTKCHKTIDNLHNEKNILAMDNELSVQIAFNKLKSKLNHSITAIERNIDLNDEINIHGSFEEITKKIIKGMESKQGKSNEILNDKEIQSMIQNISDNFATKIQSLLDIKSNLEELEILDKRTDV
ncbi:hypothetical protein [Paenibacillus xylanexedens]|uniref:hypothetical protein n=1 Tax=Paenibacillus xylanexedens TaxID=528191 RepID=UPI003CFF3DC8